MSIYFAYSSSIRNLALNTEEFDRTMSDVNIRMGNESLFDFGVKIRKREEEKTHLRKYRNVENC
jgi:hypothetical protein